MILGIDASQANRENRSGTEWYSFYLIDEFKKLVVDREDITVRLYLRTALREDIKKDLPSNFEIKILRSPFRHFWAQGRLSLEMFLNAPDILFSPAHTIPLIHPKNTFTTLHDIGFEDCPELYDRLSLWYHKFSAKLAVRKAKHIFTISGYSKNRIVEKYKCDPKKISVIPLGYDTQKYQVQPDKFVEQNLKKYGLEPKKYFFFIGRLEPKKNIARIVEAYKLLRKDFPEAPKLVFAGREIDLSGVDRSQATWLGYIDEKDKPFLYTGASAFVFPTLYEGFGLPILEAQACGTPVITSNTTSNPEVAGGGALIVDPRSVVEISNAMREALQNKTKIINLKKLGLENVQRFSWGKTSVLTLEKILE